LQQCRREEVCFGSKKTTECPSTLLQLKAQLEANSQPLPMDETSYVIRFEELLWGGLLLAVTMALHGLGMVITITLTDGFKSRFAKSLFTPIAPVVLASWLILIVHLLEVGVWARFFVWVRAFPNVSLAYYFSLLQYTTVGSQYNLPLHWRLLGGMIAIAGLMTFAWSTGVLVTLAQEFQSQQFERMARKKLQKSAQPPL